MCPKVKGGKSSEPPKGPRIKTVETENDPDEEIATIGHVGHGNKPIQVEFKLDGQPLCMELDTGASRALISEVTYRTLFKDRLLEVYTVQLRTYSGEMLKVAGEVKVVVSYGNQEAKLLLIVVEGDGASLFGCSWLQYFQLNWAEVKAVRTGDPSAVLEQNAVVFGQELGELKGYTASIHVDPQARPWFCKPRPVPYAMQSKVDRLVSNGILEPVQYSECMGSSRGCCLEA